MPRSKDEELAWLLEMAEAEDKALEGCGGLLACGLPVSYNKLEKQKAATPWIEEFPLQVYCPGCHVNCDTQHEKHCHFARCVQHNRQWLMCGCEGPDKWTGLINPIAHKTCLDKDYWCRTLIVHPDGSEHPVASKQQSEDCHAISHGAPGWKGYTVRWHVRCRRSDLGSYADVNRALAEG